jgi:hypothetical protein
MPIAMEGERRRRGDAMERPGAASVEDTSAMNISAV